MSAAPPVTQTRLEFLRRAGSIGAGLTLLTASPSAARPRRRRSHRPPTVAVLGGGVAGLTAAHELVDRGFDVTVYERKALGGKARSVPVPGSASGGRRPLPGEHGYRICLGTYQYLPDTMQRIPAGRGSVYDRLVKGGDILLARSGGRADLHTFLTGPPPRLTLGFLPPELAAWAQFASRVPGDELAFWVRQVVIYLTSSDQRRFGQWEYLSMWDYMRADGKSPEYQRLLTDMCSHLVQSTPSRLASARAHMNLWEAIVYCAAGQGQDGRSVAELLDAPTNEAWIDPWIRFLQTRGARFHVGYTVDALHLEHGRIASATARDKHGATHPIDADYYVCAVPVERARELLDNAILATDPRLEAIRNIQVRWMNGIQYYFRRPVDINHGHVFYIDSPWVISSISQPQFWPRDFAETYGDGTAHDCLSVVASEWQQPGILYGKPARDCTPAQIAGEIWAQMKAALEDTGRSYLPDDVLQSWFLDPAIRYRNTPTAPAATSRCSSKPPAYTTTGPKPRPPYPTSSSQPTTSATSPRSTPHVWTARARPHERRSTHYSPQPGQASSPCRSTSDTPRRSSELRSSSTPSASTPVSHTSSTRPCAGRASPASSTNKSVSLPCSSASDSRDRPS
jgi:uncharacterized protein with NAD-binding domain and iron-sulfur cluster